MPEIFTTTGQHFSCSEGQSLLDAMLAANIFIESPCGGNGKCGKCKVKITGNAVSEAADEDKACLSASDIAANFRLACTLYPDKAITIQLQAQEKGHAILSEGYMPDFTPDIIISGNSYGLAVDIGTTTVVVSLIDLQSGCELGTEAVINPQRNQGLDVLSRISYVQEHGKEGLATLQRSIISAIEDMALKLCAENNIAHNSLLDISVSANTTMLHLLLAENPLSLGIRPFTPVFTNGQDVKASELGMKYFANARVMTLPLVSAYIGADIVAGAYVCDMKHQTGNVLFIDIGTNGEMILAADGKLFACSCAAGPALEGMNISCGMRAAEGAVESVHIGQDGAVRLQVIGNTHTHPNGICGSGILSAVRELLRISLIAPNGRLARKNELQPDNPYYSLCQEQDGKPVIYLSPEIYITQGDIRQVQLAKGAVLSGVLAMLYRANIKPDELHKVLVAGQFGAHLPAEDLISCGLLPETLSPDKVKYVGNTSKTGAYIALLSNRARHDMEILAREINYIELAEMNGYERLLAKCMKFTKL